MIRAKQLRKEYPMGDTVVRALDGVDVTIAAGEFVSVIGSSGSGKSTLMHIIGCLDRPTSGSLEFNGQLVSKMPEKALARIRNEHVGFVFQTFNLINRTSALDNVLLPLIYSRRSVSKKQAMAALDRVSLTQRAKHTPSEMSGGECQRVAIARAIVNQPKLLLADEPTGNLDTRTGDQIMGIFHELHAAGITIVLVTHEMEIAAQADRMIRMRDGCIIEDVKIDETRRDEIVTESHGSERRLLHAKDAKRGTSSPLKRQADGEPLHKGK